MEKCKSDKHFERLIIWCSSSEYTFPTACSYSVCILRGTQWKGSMWRAVRRLQKLDMFSKFWHPQPVQSQFFPSRQDSLCEWRESWWECHWHGKTRTIYCRLCAAANLILWIRCMSSVWHGAITASVLMPQLQKISIHTSSFHSSAFLFMILPKIKQWCDTIFINLTLQSVFFFFYSVYSRYTSQNGVIISNNDITVHHQFFFLILLDSFIFVISLESLINKLFHYFHPQYNYSNTGLNLYSIISMLCYFHHHKNFVYWMYFPGL